MKITRTIAATAVILSMTVGASTMALAKAHDQGAADGSSPPSTSDVVDSIPGPGVSSLFNGGQRGEAASGNKGDNRVEPVVGNGKNSRDEDPD